MHLMKVDTYLDFSRPLWNCWVLNHKMQYYRPLVQIGMGKRALALGACLEGHQNNS